MATVIPRVLPSPSTHKLQVQIWGVGRARGREMAGPPPQSPPPCLPDQRPQPLRLTGPRAPEVRRRRGSLGCLVPQTCQTPCPWGLLPSLPGLPASPPRNPDCASPWRQPCLSPEGPQPGLPEQRPPPAPSSPVPGPTPTHRRRHTQPHTKPRRGEAGGGDARQPANMGAHKDWPRTGARPRPRGQRAPRPPPQSPAGPAQPGSPRGLLPTNTAAASLRRAGRAW